MTSKFFLKCKRLGVNVFHQRFDKRIAKQLVQTIEFNKSAFSRNHLTEK